MDGFSGMLPQGRTWGYETLHLHGRAGDCWKIFRNSSRTLKRISPQATAGSFAGLLFVEISLYKTPVMISCQELLYFFSRSWI